MYKSYFVFIVLIPYLPCIHWIIRQAIRPCFNSFSCRHSRHYSRKYIQISCCNNSKLTICYLLYFHDTKSRIISVTRVTEKVFWKFTWIIIPPGGLISFNSYLVRYNQKINVSQTFIMIYIFTFQCLGRFWLYCKQIK